MLKNIDTKKIVDIAVKAGEIILEIYNTDDFETEIKSDNSPLTKADKASNDYIVEKLNEFYPEIPVISEEGKDIPVEERKSWKYFWLVDPLDGTKEFIKRNGEFTVNIALIKGTESIMGVVHAPVLNKTFFSEGTKAYISENNNVSEITVSDGLSGNLKAVRSRSHGSEEEERIFNALNIKDFEAIGSSLKLCLVADGTVDFYYRHGPTWEWDTAAGAAILKAAGGVYSSSFNKDSLLNGSFYCASDYIEAKIKELKLL